jgi:hypothetical protein
MTVPDRFLSRRMLGHYGYRKVHLSEAHAVFRYHYVFLFFLITVELSLGSLLGRDREFCHIY